MRNQPGKKNSTTVLKTEIFLYFRVCMFECSNKHYFFFKKKKKIVKSVFVKTILKSKNKSREAPNVSLSLMNIESWVWL